jgi:hypothetical protein
MLSRCMAVTTVGFVCHHVQECCACEPHVRHGVIYVLSDWEVGMCWRVQHVLLSVQVQLVDRVLADL